MNALPTSLLFKIEVTNEGPQWLIQSIWSKSAVGVIGGAPKSCKSWFGLDMAVSVASGTPCMDRYTVEDPGTALIYLAEDSLEQVKNRVSGICRHRNLNFESLPLHTITTPTLRLDEENDRLRLVNTLTEVQPKMLLLDPFIRMHRLDENSARDISGVLGFLRELQRAFNMAVILTHHASKKHHARPGQALRGSSDLHAFGDSNLYLNRKKDGIELIIEHRSAPSLEPMMLELAEHDDGVYLQLANSDIKNQSSLPDRILTYLKTCEKPVTRTLIRQQLHVNNQKLGDTLLALQKGKQVIQTKEGWQLNC